MWLPEVGLGLGRDRGKYLGIEREWLYWYDVEGQRLATPEEWAEQAEARAEQAEQRLQTLLTQLQQRGIDLNDTGLE